MKTLLARIIKLFRKPLPVSTGSIEGRSGARPSKVIYRGGTGDQVADDTIARMTPEAEAIMRRSAKNARWN